MSLLRLFRPKPQSTADEIKKQREVWLQQMLDKSQELERLIKVNNTGWKEVAGLLNDYIAKAKQRKTATALDRATEADIYELKLLDHEVYLLSWVLKIPEQFIGAVEAEIERQKEKENA
jgi:hypothetical protein